MRPLFIIAEVSSPVSLGVIPRKKTAIANALIW